MARPARELTPYRSSRHFYGAEMRRYRQTAGMTLDAVAALVPHSRSQVHRVETAEMLPPPDLSPVLDQVFEAGEHFQRLYELVRQGQEIHPEQYRRRMEIESRACTIAEFAGQVVPGLVQTADYARALFMVSNPRVAPAKIEDLVAARLSRQSLLRAEHAPDISFVLDEAVLRRPVGGAEVMCEQMALLETLATSPNCSIQVLPFEHGAHALLGGTLTLMSVENGPTVAYEESIGTGTLLDRPEDVRQHRRSYDLLRAYALSPSATADIIRKTREELSHVHRS